MTAYVFRYRKTEVFGDYASDKDALASAGRLALVQESRRSIQLRILLVEDNPGDAVLVATHSNERTSDISGASENCS